MNHYPHHIGDFNNATRHLTRVERALYRDLIDLYYDTEQPLPGDDFDRLAKRILANTDEEKAALKCVLSEFFVLENGVYRNRRCDKEINRYQTVIASASRAGRASAEKRLNGKLTSVQRPLAPRTTNQNQNQNQNQNHKKTRGSRLGETDLIALGVDEQAARDWITVRKAKDGPLTQTALDDLKREATKAGITVAEAVLICARKNWRGFNASWDWRDAMPKKTAAQLLDEAQAHREAA